MPLSINVGLSRKASENYQSAGVSINVTAELGQSLLARPDELQQEIAGLYAQAQQALDRQLPAPNNAPQRGPEPQAPRNAARYSRNGGDGNGEHNGNGGYRNGNGHHGHNGQSNGSNRRNGGSMTDSQRRAIDAISRRLNLDPDHEAREVLGLGMDQLTIRQASELIDHLKSLQSAGDGAQGASGANGSGR
jgi:hypothetical protein